MYNQQILDTTSRVGAKVLLTVKGNYLMPATLEKLNRLGIRTVNYYPDFRFGYQSLDQDIFPLFSLFVTTKSFQVAPLSERLGADKVRFLHHGYCSDVHVPPSLDCLQGVKPPDVLYVGTYTRHKEVLFSQLVKSLPGIDFKIYGNGWDSVSDAALRGSCVGRPLYGMNYAQLARAARINLAIHMGPADATGWEDLVSTRTFELPACKAFMLHVDNAEVRELFAVGEEIDVFTSAEDLCAKISYYLDREALRREMAEKAYLRCVPAHSYDARAATIAAWLAAL